MKKRMIAVLFVMVCGLVFANGLSENPAETLIPDDAQLTFMPNAWAKTSYNRALFNLELDQSEFNFGFGVKFGVFKLGLKLKSDYNFIFPHKSYSESVK